MKREKQIKFRMSVKEYEDFIHKLEKTGMSQQAFILSMLMEVKIYDKEVISELKSLNEKFDSYLRQVKGIATNINQMARIVNVNRNLPEAEKMNEIYKMVSEIKEEGNSQWQSQRLLIRELKHMGH